MNKIAVWDTYVPLPGGSVLHFDVLVPAEITDRQTIHGIGKKHLERKGYPDVHIQTEYCQFCHLEEPDEEIKKALESVGFYILEMETIPAVLPDNPSRRAMILHLRAHDSRYRFSDFRGKTIEELRLILDGIKS